MFQRTQPTTEHHEDEELVRTCCLLGSYSPMTTPFNHHVFVALATLSYVTSLMSGVLIPMTSVVDKHAADPTFNGYDIAAISFGSVGLISGLAAGITMFATRKTSTRLSTEATSLTPRQIV